MMHLNSALLCIVVTIVVRCLQVQRRETHRANQVDALATHQLQVEKRESVINQFNIELLFQLRELVIKY